MQDIRRARVRMVSLLTILCGLLYMCVRIIEWQLFVENIGLEIYIQVKETLYLRL